MEIRRVEPGDGPLLARSAALFDGPLRPDAVERFLGSADHHLLLAVEGDEPIGFVSGVELTHPDKGTEMFLYELGVAEGARRRGVATALVEALLTLAGTRGCRGMWALTEPENHAAVATYLRARAGQQTAPVMFEWDLAGGTEPG